MKNICLTFDDGLKSHYEFVRPLLKNNEIKGTFFICVRNAWGTGGENGHPLHEDLMSAEELKQMQLDGFELGNHTHSHLNLTELGDDQVTNEIHAANDFFKKHSLNLPTSFCYPGYHASIKISKILKKLNFTHARTGYICDDHPSQHSKDVERPKVSYHPLNNDSPLLIKSTGIVNDVYKFEDFKKDVEEAPDDSYCVFTFHGFRSKDRANDFIKIVNYIKENNFPTFNLSELPVETDVELLEQWPFRCPVKDVAVNIKDIVKNKRFCDVGCGGGDLLFLVSQYTESAFGVEKNKRRFNIAKERGLEVYNQDFFKKIPLAADVYFFWINMEIDAKVLDHLFESVSHPFTALLNRRKEYAHTLDRFSAKYPMEKRFFSYHEEKSVLPYSYDSAKVTFSDGVVNVGSGQWPLSGEWCTAIIKND